MTSSGDLQTQTFYPNGDTFTATWDRAAGSATGTCSFQVYDPDNPFDNLQFNFTFTLLEYTGPLTYTPGSNTVAAALILTQTGNPANTLQGSIVFDKSATDRFNTLTNHPGVWTNAAGQTFSFTNEVFTRDAAWPTNYSGYVPFADGNPDTAGSDYRLWVLSIDDTNDVNGNGVPDFSDDPAGVAPPAAPLLSLTTGPTNLWLTISGDVGHTNEIQELDSLTATNWQTRLTFMFTNDPQVVKLPLPLGPTAFWRVLAR
ncbi:MAG: hypothetical protein KGJ60_09750 [Verrucomicrobiota bacterium]|nr:hypothetical protein [Verrucomicrobiota bacterium]